MKAMSEQLLEQLAAARADIDEQIAEVIREKDERCAELRAEGERIDAAREALCATGSARPTPARTSARGPSAAKRSPAAPSSPAPGPSRTPAVPKLRGRSRGLVLDYLREHGPSRTQAIATACGIAKSSMGDLTKRMEAEGEIVLERKEGTSQVWGLPGAVAPASPAHVEDKDLAGDQEPDDAGPVAAPAISSRVRREVEREGQSPAPAQPSSLRPEGPVLRQRIDARLRRSAAFPSEIAKEFAVPMAEVTTELAVLRELGGRGQGPKVLKHESGSYFIDEDEAQNWPLERAA